MSNYKNMAELGYSYSSEYLRNHYREMVNTELLGINNIPILFHKSIFDYVSRFENMYERVVSSNISETILLESYHSATIEGAKTTVENVRKAIANKDFSKSDLMVYNVIKATSYAMDQKCITVGTMKHVWDLVSSGCCDNMSCQGDYYRKDMVYVGSDVEIVHTPEYPDKIRYRMDALEKFNLCSDLHPVIKAAITHFYYVYIHPMCDGNGRMSRILYLATLCSNGFDKCKHLPVVTQINRNLPSYLSSLQKSETPIAWDIEFLDITPTIEFMCNMLLDSMKINITINEELSDSERLLLTRINRDGISVAKCSKMLKVNKFDAQVLLNNLVEKGVLHYANNVYKM